MHPAFSVIFFTVVSGSGYGLLFLLGTLLTLDPQRVSGKETIIAIALGGAFAAAGLLSSMLHLGQPQRAWRAFSQWRSSWLSREGVASTLSFAPMLVLAWLEWRVADATLLRAWGVLLAACAALTVICTAKIYTTLKTISAWHNAYVLPGYLLLGLLGGAAWIWVLQIVYATTAGALPILVAVLALVSALYKYSYWRHIDALPPAATAESATGLGRFGAVRSVEAPHTEENYLTREMGFVLARKHARRLRGICLMLIGVIPMAFALAGYLVQMRVIDALCAILAVLCVTLGLFVERWLFFAEAKHVVMLYYGARPLAQRA
jgi:DMSO reductase anchor subunit